MATVLRHTAGNGFIRLALVAPFCSYLRERGHNPTPCLKALDISEEALEDHSLFAHADVMYGLLEDFAKQAGEPYLGIHVGEAFDLQAWPPVGTAMNGAETLGAFLTNFIKRVPKEANSVEHSLVVDAMGASYCVTRKHPTAVASHQNTGFGCALFVRLLMQAMGSAWNPDTVSFESPYTKGIPKNYRGLQIEQIKSQRLQNCVLRLRFPAEWLFVPTQQLAHTRVMLWKDMAPDVSIVLAVRAILSGRLEETKFDDEEISALLGMTPNRLKRALAEKDTTLSREIKRLRIDRAKELLRRKGLTITEIGLAVGYVDKAHFTRFFRSQTGITPSAYRAQDHT